jgi:hypothetical protein
LVLQAAEKWAGISGYVLTNEELKQYANTKCEIKATEGTKSYFYHLKLKKNRIKREILKGPTSFKYIN